MKQITGNMVKRNPFAKEYNTGRKDQFDLDYGIFMKCVNETNTREELIACVDEKLKFVISKLAEANSTELMEGLELF